MRKVKLSKYFNLSEFEYSDTAKKNGIVNKIPVDILPNIIRLHDNILFPLRKQVGYPVKITSGYRCFLLNRFVGGAVTSQHCTGQAADIVVQGQSNMAVFNWIRKNCEFDQLILETVKGTQWVHVSYNFGSNRKVCLSYDGKCYKAI